MMASDITIDSVHRLLTETSNQQQNLTEALVRNETKLASLTQALENAEKRLQRLECYFGSRSNTGDAGSRVGGIPELLALILVHLPMRDLLFARRVSMKFKDIIDRSETLQRALFLVPEPVPERMSIDRVRLNPLLLDQRSYTAIPLYRSTTRSERAVLLKSGSKQSGRLAITKCQVGKMKIRSGTPTSTTIRYEIDVQLGVLPSTYSSGRIPKRLPDGSWRRMYLSQPPLRVWLRFEGSSSAYAPRPDNFKFGSLFAWKTLTSRHRAEENALSDSSDADEVSVAEDEE